MLEPTLKGVYPKTCRPYSPRYSRGKKSESDVIIVLKKDEYAFALTCDLVES